MSNPIRLILALALASSCLVGCGGASGSGAKVYGSAGGDAAGVTWQLDSVAYGNGTYVAVGFGGLGSGQGDTIGAWVQTSTDGLHWTLQDSGESSIKGAQYTDVMFGAGVFVVIDTVNNRAYESPNGKSWKQILGAADPTGGGWDGSEFLVFTGTSGIEVSPDGVNWHSVPQGALGVDIPVSLPVYFNGQWYAIIDDGPSTGIGVSSDLKTFKELVPSSVSDEFSGLSLNGSVLFAYGNAGLIATSPDGVTWTDSPVTTADSFDEILFNGKVYVASAFEPAAANATEPEVLLYSADGINWSKASIDAAATGKISAGPLTIGKNGEFVAVDGEFSLVSQDGVNWTLGGG